ncbi:MAG TPA: response regulator [Mucilaginibacter sp.]|jgi:twitching motility two-component system response regulator PilH|nr:response regulator [Mucilaginibacter sp.]
MPKQIILIENDNDFRWVLTLMLEELGHEVISFDHVENIDQLISHPADVYIVDEQLPGINGHIFSIILKSKPATKDVPVILISGSEKLEYMASIGDTDHFLKKPFTQEDLKNVLSKLN